MTGTDLHTYILKYCRSNSRVKAPYFRRLIKVSKFETGELIIVYRDKFENLGEFKSTCDDFLKFVSKKKDANFEQVKKELNEYEKS